MQSEADVYRLEEKLLSYFTTPTTAITSEQTHGLYGVPVGGLSTDNDENAGSDTDDLPAETQQALRVDAGVKGRVTAGAAAGRRRKAKSWLPGAKE
ncbi:hypothetical protein [Paracoccus sp. (in: a-proteobacteria)]|uniref:hypothetical protein n=1 Tax=Paracoccus sp. TaxID=267 RepID=UPI00289D73FE|nr:hypothetical protein [Paracoccus sp. (in: a-proteobacteria)]